MHISTVSKRLYMEILEQFTALRKSLEPLVQEWTPILSVLKKEICNIKNENERLAFKIELNKFCNTYESMKSTSTVLDEVTTLEIKTNMMELHHIKMELNEKEEPDNIGDEIITKLIAPVEEVLGSSKKEKLLERIRMRAKRSILL